MQLSASPTGSPGGSGESVLSTKLLPAVEPEGLVDPLILYDWLRLEIAPATSESSVTMAFRTAASPVIRPMTTIVEIKINSIEMINPESSFQILSAIMSVLADNKPTALPLGGQNLAPLDLLSACG